MKRFIQQFNFIALLAWVCVSQPFANDFDVVTDSDLAQLLQHYEVDHDSLRSFYRLPVSQTKLDRIHQFQMEWEEKLAGIDFEALNQSGRIDYLLFKNHLWYESKQFEFQSKLDEESLSLLPFAGDILTLEETRWRAVEIDPEDSASTLSVIKDKIGFIQDQLKAGLRESQKNKENDLQDITLDVVDESYDEPAPLVTTAVIANRAANELGHLSRILDHWFEHYDPFHPSFHWWVNNVYQDTNKVLNDYRDFLREEIAGYEEGEDAPLIGDPIGKDRLLVDLQYEMIPYSPEELIEIANKEFAWCEREMDRAAKELGYEDDWHDALEHVKGLHVPPGEQDQLVYQQSIDVIAFLDERELLTVPDLCRETWRLEMSGKQRQTTHPYAFYGGQHMGVAFSTKDMNPEGKHMSMRGNNIHFSRLVTPHELIPGHHLQIFMANRYNTQRRQFSTPFLIEGWALYWEMLLWDLDYPRGPEDRIGMLFWRMHRCARIIVSLKFHLNEMSPQEMIDFLIERVGHEKDAATSEVRRFIGGNYSPLYQCAYMLGGLQIRSMRRELVDSGKMTDREFHDAILRENEMPIQLIRAKLTGQELDNDEISEWRFYDFGE